MCGTIAHFAAGFVRMPGNSGYFILFVLLLGAGIAFLATTSPPDKKFTELYRSSIITTVMGALLTFWDLIPLLPWWSWLAVPIAGVVALAFVGARV